jgi:hypothetical protein
MDANLRSGRRLETGRRSESLIYIHVYIYIFIYLFIERILQICDENALIWGFPRRIGRNVDVKC